MQSATENEKQLLFQTVDAFAEAMKAKLSAKLEEGYRGWDDPLNYAAIADSYEKHFCKPSNSGANFVDVANFAMFLWNIHRQFNNYEGE